MNKLKIKLYHFSIPPLVGFFQYFKYSIPFFLPYFIGQLNGLVEKYLAVQLPVGTLSVLDFSRRIPDIFNGILVSVVLTILVPTLTKFFINIEKEKYDTSFLETFRLGLLILIAFNIYFFSSSVDILPILYGSISISEQDMVTIVKVSQFFSLAMFAVFAYIIFGMSMLSINKGKYYALYGSLAQCIMMGFNFLFIKYFKIYIFPISFCIAHFTAAIFMYLQYPYNKLQVIKTFAKYILFGMVVFLLYVVIIKYTFDFSIHDSVWERIRRTGFSFLILAILFLSVGMIFKINEVKALKHRFIKSKL